MNLNISLNPYYLYSISSLLILVLYSLGWSDLYPEISLMTKCFFIISSIVSLIFGYLFDKKFVKSKSDEIIFSNNKVENKSYLNIKNITIAILIANVVEFIYSGAIPFVEIAILKNDYLYLEYGGIPTFHVILFTFNAFFAVFIFHRLLIENKRSYIIYFILNLLPSALTYNRGMLMMIGISCVSVFVLEKWEGLLHIKRIVILAILGIIFIYFFGIAGNIRSNSTYDIDVKPADSRYIMMVGEASKEFRHSIIPKPMFWGYIYMTSPLANFETNVNYYENANLDIDSVGKFINKSIIPDFISKRIDGFFDYDYDKVKQVSPNLTVSSFLSDAFVNLGWIGVIAIFVYFIVLVWIYRFLLGENSSFLITGMSILNTITMLNFFSNMFTFSGLSFQLIYPVIFTMIYKEGYWRDLSRKLKNLINFKRRL
ncbi:oligosaccharide repeat unit polymerase [Paraclostridium bifermentans]|uniref:O-antigen polymerase n=1 Tax=Paraclostridium bifermentans TaxID=1490 RepID=UPI002149BA8E|nr:O-antigen polymerase [Paraclostridium bifermentans]MCR1875992.1 oligosaccharide repeat unit polymerase [Paraclostridium bifermentans]